MQVTAFSTAARPEWRWRICDYGGEIVEESHDHFLTIAAAVAQGAERLAHMNAVDRARAARGDSTNHARRRGRTRFASSVRVAT
jgi:hypothetical protein